MKHTPLTGNKTLNVRGLILGLAVAVIFLRHDATAAQAPVALGSADSFVILAKSGISTTGTTSIGGDIGVSPIGSTAITGFGLIMDPSGQFSSSSLVIGKIYAADYAVTTPAKMTAAVSDMETAYTDAAARTLPDATELYAGDISGQTFGPGLYKWSTGLLINADVTLAGPADAVWIFQVAGNLTMGSGTKVLLSGGAQAKNIFWQIAGGVGVEIGTTAHVEGDILAAKAIHLRTGASLNGRALAQTAVTLDANTITIPNTVTGSVILESAAKVTGQYTVAAGQSVNLETRTITVPTSGDMQFYRLRSDTALTITGISLSGGNVEITYN
ncbi:MAG: DUF3494 domain-containing protein [Verrucomicrobia bacterium]|nr:DUF3494 domain-containing protein [Verrucomicrobiota bacterium]